MDYKDYQNLVSQTPELKNGWSVLEKTSFYFRLIIYRDKTETRPLESAVFRNRDGSIHSHTKFCDDGFRIIRYFGENGNLISEKRA